LFLLVLALTANRKNPVECTNQASAPSLEQPLSLFRAIPSPGLEPHPHLLQTRRVHPTCRLPRRRQPRQPLPESLFPANSPSHLHHHEQRQNCSDRNGQSGVPLKKESVRK